MEAIKQFLCGGGVRQVPLDVRTFSDRSFKCHLYLYLYLCFYLYLYLYLYLYMYLCWYFYFWWWGSASSTRCHNFLWSVIQMSTQASWGLWIEMAIKEITMYQTVESNTPNLYLNFFTLWFAATKTLVVSTLKVNFCCPRVIKKIVSPFIVLFSAGW